MSTNERQIGGDHYKKPIQHWDWVASNNLDYFQGQITKYVARWKEKNGMEDLEKAKHFLEKYIELVKKETEKGLGITRDALPPKVQRIDLTGQPTPFGYNRDLD